MILISQVLQSAEARADKPAASTLTTNVKPRRVSGVCIHEQAMLGRAWVRGYRSLSTPSCCQTTFFEANLREAGQTPPTAYCPEEMTCNLCSKSRCRSATLRPAHLRASVASAKGVRNA